MKFILKFFIAFFLLQSFALNAQQGGSIDNISGMLIPKKKRLTTYLDGKPQKFYYDTAYTLVVTVKTQNIGLQDKIVLKLGQNQNDTTVFKKQLKFLDHGVPNKKCSHDDNPGNKEYDEIRMDMLQVKFEISKTDFMNLKWASVCVKNGNTEGPYKYYEFK